MAAKNNSVSRSAGPSTQVSREDCGSSIVVGFRTGLFSSVFALTNVKAMQRTHSWMQ